MYSLTNLEKEEQVNSELMNAALDILNDSTQFAEVKLLVQFYI